MKVSISIFLLSGNADNKLSLYPRFVFASASGLSFTFIFSDDKREAIDVGW